MTNKRKIPDGLLLEKRKKIVAEMYKLIPLPPNGGINALPIGLENGNKKTGEGGSIFSRIFVWNLPLIVTCPGASEWCITHCYNADERSDVYPIEQWCVNWWWCINNLECIKSKIIQQLSEADNESIAVRFHSCGDFYSTDYIEMWHEICTVCPNVKFWGYTRSWVVPDLKDAIVNLATFENVQLFASWDTSMPQPPEIMRKSIVLLDNTSVLKHSGNQNSKICPEQYGLVRCCADCASCICKSQKDAIFIIH